MSIKNFFFEKFRKSRQRYVNQLIIFNLIFKKNWHEKAMISYNNLEISFNTYQRKKRKN